MCMRRIVGGVMLALLAQYVYAEEKIAATDFVYQVKKGDNLTKFSNEVLDRTTRWPEVAAYNKLSSAHLIYPGEILHVPFAWLKNYPAEARIEALAGEVKLNGKAALVGDVVPTGAKIETASGASTRLSLPDGSTLNVLEKSNVEAKELSKKSSGNFFSAIFRLASGRIDAVKKKYPNGQAPLRIQTMHATIGVRGTHFRMGEENGKALAEIENGLVGFEVENTPNPLALSGGEGSVADGIKPPAVIPLLPAPKFPELPMQFNRPVVRFVMPELPGAHGFRGEIAKDENFAEMVAPVHADNNQINIAKLKDGHYWLRLRGVDGQGLQGLEQKIPFELKVLPLIPETPTFERGRLVMRWAGEAGAQYELQVASEADFSESLITHTTLKSYLILPRPDAGRYYVRLREISDGDVGEWSQARPFNVPEFCPLCE